MMRFPDYSSYESPLEAVNEAVNTEPYVPLCWGYIFNCFNNNGGSRTGFHKPKNSIRIHVRHSCDQPETWVTWMGGEPLLQTNVTWRNTNSGTRGVNELLQIRSSRQQVAGPLPHRCMTFHENNAICPSGRLLYLWSPLHGCISLLCWSRCCPTVRLKEQEKCGQATHAMCKSAHWKVYTLEAKYTVWSQHTHV